MSVSSHFYKFVVFLVVPSSRLVRVPSSLFPDVFPPVYIFWIPPLAPLTCFDGFLSTFTLLPDKEKTTLK